MRSGSTWVERPVPRGDLRLRDLPHSPGAGAATGAGVHPPRRPRFAGHARCLRRSSSGQGRPVRMSASRPRRVGAATACGRCAVRRPGGTPRRGRHRARPDPRDRMGARSTGPPRRPGPVRRRRLGIIRGPHRRPRRPPRPRPGSRAGKAASWSIRPTRASVPGGLVLGRRRTPPPSPPGAPRNDAFYPGVVRRLVLPDLVEGRRPRVGVHTTAGSFLVELSPADARSPCALSRLARATSSVRFRVVPDFVIRAESHRDGGSGPGYAIRDR